MDKHEIMDKHEFDRMNSTVISEFRATGGVVGGPFEGATLLLLTSTGAKSGQPRLAPLEPDDRPGLSKEDDLLDIPAFLRRQAN